MTPGAIALLSISMSTDAFAAAVGRGATKRPGWAAAIRTGAVFGVIEGITPIIGWSLGLLAASVVQQVDHWIAFGLLSAVGVKAILDAVSDDASEDAPVAKSPRSGIVALLAMAVGTSLDAAAIGVGLAFIQVDIWLIAACIGLSTFLFTTLGMRIGGVVGARFGKWAELAGGITLIGIGTEILLDHLGYLG
ncbi:manganese efflux pump MntP family protein [Stakelama pacifica]|uniref:Putative manganese efflux pump MntP n=1 Tax=Stakelama pacifica TaxID=517720 RepID=A0A4R6FEK1_9SPHN|nr:manganese efflux pump MntP family protein [Stakelama pacifica]TDN78764.1 putative Mn2+ efflux pump MntP [Stakelama pacifica]